MKNSETLTLIDGKVTYDEVKEIILNMISSKVNFHQIKNLSSQERFGKDDEVAQKRIPALKIEMNKLNEFLSDASSRRFVVKSEINISIMEE
jgi:hypothetical protein